MCEVLIAATPAMNHDIKDFDLFHKIYSRMLVSNKYSGIIYNQNMPLQTLI